MNSVQGSINTIFANAIIQVFPESEQLSNGEWAIWGICMSLAALLGGAMVIVYFREVKPDWRWLARSLFAMSMLFLAVAVFLATRGNIRSAQERYKAFQEERERSKGTEGQPD